MTLSSIQKQKFLETVYKNYFSSGIKIDEQKVLELYSQYFSRNSPGNPIRLNPEIFRSTEFSNTELINEKNATLLLNIENLYDVIFENSDELFDVTNALNSRIEHLRKKRSELEDKVDALLFSNQNSDGFFASIYENFATGNAMNYALSDVFLDTESKRVTLSKSLSNNLDLISSSSIVSPDVRYDLSFNRTIIEKTKSIDDSSFFGSVFDGLNNTEWSKYFDFESIGVVTLSINIPINQLTVISKIQGRLNMVTPADIYIKVNYQNEQFPSEVKSKKSLNDYDNFSFEFTPGVVSSIDLILSKVDPDYVNTQSAKKYQYRFGIRDIIISGQSYEQFGSYISEPYSLPTKDNKNLVIDTVSVDVDEVSNSGGSISYFIAQDTGSETNISDFSWIPVSRPFDSSGSFASSVSLNGSSTKSFSIVDSIKNENTEIEKIPLKTSGSSTNINEENPTSTLYGNQSIYRIGQIKKIDNPYNSYILEGINFVSGKYVNYIDPIYDETEKLSTWNKLIDGRDDSRLVVDIPSYQITKDPVFFTGLNLSQVSILLPLNLYCAKDIVVSHRFVKNDSISLNWNVSVYINEAKYSIPAGKSYADIEWRLSQGLNKIYVAIDCPMSSIEAKAASANGSITLMESHSILQYGIVYSNYFSYVDPMELRYSRSSSDNVFSIDNVFGNSEIISKKNISSNSKIFYFTNSPNPVTKIRLRADFSRGNNQLSSPILNSYRIKFKNSNSFSEQIQKQIDNNS